MSTVGFGSRRGHVGSRGPKNGYTYSSARHRARSMMIELGRPFRPYQCGVCGWWHVGSWSPRPPVRTEVERLELGERAAGCLAMENYGAYTERAVLQRCAAVARRRAREVLV